MERITDRISMMAAVSVVASISSDAMFDRSVSTVDVSFSTAFVSSDITRSSATIME